MWLANRESEKAEIAAGDRPGVRGGLERPKMWRSVEHLRSLSLSCAPDEDDASITERVSRDMETTLKYHQPQSVDTSPSSRAAFNLEKERQRMAQWTAEQERVRKVTKHHHHHHHHHHHAQGLKWGRVARVGDPAPFDLPGLQQVSCLLSCSSKSHKIPPIMHQNSPFSD